MLSPKSLITRFVLQLLLIMLCYLFSRFLFIYFNFYEFDIPSLFSVDFIRLLMGGARYDLAAFFMTNGIILLLGYFPLHYLSGKIYQQILGVIFVIVNSFFLMLNFADIAYFPFVRKRMQFDILQFMDGDHGNEFYRLIPVLIVHYWYLFIIFFIVVWLIWKANNFIQGFREMTKPGLISYFYIVGIYVFIIFFLIIGVRGGFQYKPIKVIDASKMAIPQNIPIVLNTPFTIINSIKHNRIGFEVPGDFNPDELKMSIKYPVEGSKFKAYNIVLIIVEGLSRQYIGHFSEVKAAPFLDSLIENSLLFTDFYANGKTTLEGIPAILASIPGWMDQPFIYSSYSGQSVTSFATLLKKQKYQTSFFHGGKNGTMGFTAFTKLAGIEQYFGKNEYDDDSDFDGKWGIWDEDFLRFTASEISEMQQPFFSTIVTLNNHHPFQIPAQYENEFKYYGHPIWKCIRYTDHSLKTFFREARKADWYNNTLFIITADHTALDVDPNNKGFMKDYAIPLIINMPDGHLKGLNNTIGNQIDILPTVMALMSYQEPFFSLGKDLLGKMRYRYSLNYSNGIYSFFDDEFLYLSNGSECRGFYNYKKDPQLKKNLADDLVSSDFKRFKDEFVRQLSVYTLSLDNNKLTAEKNN